jgi:ATP-dependent protease ClpP protease subunit
MKLLVFLGLLVALPAAIFGLSGLESNYIQSGWQGIFVTYLVRSLLLAFSLVALIFLYENLGKGSSSRLSFILAFLLVTAQAITFISKSLGLPLQIEIANNLQNIEVAEVTEIIDGYVLIDGYLGKATVESLNRYLTRNSLRGIILNSQGGFIDDANAIAIVVKEQKVNVYVKDHCESACVIIATSGSQLFAYQKSQFGFHQAGLPSITKNTQSAKFASLIGTDELTEALSRNGVPKDILDKMSETSNDSMTYYSGLDLYQRGVVNTLLD